MKSKQLVAMAALALLVALPARAAEVVSSNIVGYNKITLKSRLTMMAASFQNVGAANSTISLSQIVPGDSVTPIDWSDDDLPFGSSLLIWNGSSYIGGTYYWTGEVPREIGAEMESDLGMPVGSYNNIWVDDQYEPVGDISFPAGTAFWIQDDNRSATQLGSITVSGEVVPSTANRSVDADTRLTMMGYTYPKEISTDQLIVSDLPGIDWNDDDLPFGSSLLKWNGSSYIGGTLYWTGEVPREIGSEMETDLGLESGSYNNIWVNDQYEPDSLSIGVGEAFWIQNSDTSQKATITFPELPNP